MAQGSHPLKLEEILKKELQTTKCQGFKGFAGGGCISEGQSFDTDHGKVFVKVNDKSGVFIESSTLLYLSAQGNLLLIDLFVLFFQAMKMFEGELNSLETIFRTNTVRVPKPIKVCFDWFL